VARQRPDVRLAIGTALFPGNQERRKILGYRIAGYPVQHLSRIRRYTRQTPEHGPPATRETGDSTAPQKMIAALEPARKALMPVEHAVLTPTDTQELILELSRRSVMLKEVEGPGFEVM